MKIDKASMGNGTQIHFEVMDEESLGKDRLIGDITIPID
jgi:hypothetical protein